MYTFSPQARRKKKGQGLPRKNAAKEDQNGTEANLPPKLRGTEVFAIIRRTGKQDTGVDILGEGIGEGGKCVQDGHGSPRSITAFVQPLKSRDRQH
jgi:hypothetical protein